MSPSGRAGNAGKRPVIRRRAAAAGRPASDPRCAGCSQLGTFRALRRAGLAVDGGLGCDPRAPARWSLATGRWAAVVGGRRLARMGAGRLLEEARRAGAALVTVADIETPGRAARIVAQLEAAGAVATVVDPGDLASVEQAVARAAEASGDGRGHRVLVALAPCVRGGPRRPALAVEPARCNRCGACLALACPAILDEGGEALVVDTAVCFGCGLCVPLCRAGAIGQRRW